MLYVRNFSDFVLFSKNSIKLFKYKFDYKTNNYFLYFFKNENNKR